MASEEPRFGEVWTWGDSSPAMMVIAIGTEATDGRVSITLTHLRESTGVFDLMLYGTGPRECIREQWKRLDTEELG